MIVRRFRHNQLAGLDPAPSGSVDSANTRACHTGENGLGGEFWARCACANKNRSNNNNRRNVEHIYYLSLKHSYSHIECQLSSESSTVIILSCFFVLVA